MKKVILVLAMAATGYAANAQVSGQSKWDETKAGNDRVSLQQKQDFDNVEMTKSNHIITFAGLPQLTKPIRVVVTDAQGNIDIDRKISSVSNTIDIQTLKEKSLYFVTLMYKNRSKKAFVLNM